MCVRRKGSVIRRESERKRESVWVRRRESERKVCEKGGERVSE